jgi:hypothetical protein
MCLKVSVLVRGDLVLLDGKAILLARAFDRRLVIEVAMNGLRLECSARKLISLIVRLSASPTLEIIVAVRAEGAIAKALPVISRVLLDRTIVSRVRWG